MHQWWCNALFNFEIKTTSLLFEKFPFLVIARNMIMLPHLIIHCLLHYLSTGCLREVKSKGKFQTFSYKSHCSCLERWSLTRGSKYSHLTQKLLVFWKTGHWGEVVATEGSTVFTYCKEGANLILIHCNKLKPKTKDIIIDNDKYNTLAISWKLDN